MTLRWRKARRSLLAEVFADQIRQGVAVAQKDGSLLILDDAAFDAALTAEAESFDDSGR